LSSRADGNSFGEGNAEPNGTMSRCRVDSSTENTSSLMSTFFGSGDFLLAGACWLTAAPGVTK
jgi:hypothetical protein